MSEHARGDENFTKHWIWKTRDCGYSRGHLKGVTKKDTRPPAARTARCPFQVQWNILQRVVQPRQRSNFVDWSSPKTKFANGVECGNHDDVVISSRNCLRLPPEKKLPVEELENGRQNWVKKFPDSKLAPLFNYKIHFPAPNGFRSVEVYRTMLKNRSHETKGSPPFALEQTCGQPAQ